MAFECGPMMHGLIASLNVFVALRIIAGAKNKLVEVATGRVLTTIDAEPGMEEMNHGAVLPTRWSPDASRRART